MTRRIDRLRIGARDFGAQLGDIAGQLLILATQPRDFRPQLLVLVGQLEHAALAGRAHRRDWPGALGAPIPVLGRGGGRAHEDQRHKLQLGPNVLLNGAP